MKNVIRIAGCVALVTAVIVCGAQAEQSAKLSSVTTPSSNSSGAKLLSERSATRLSALGTVIPVGLGIVLAATASGHDEYYVDWNGTPSYRRSDPDRLPTILLTGSGLIIGPSLGYFYAGRPGRAFLGIGFRTAVGFGSLIGAFATCGWDCGPGDGAYDAAWGIIGAGTVLMAGSAIYDIAKVGRAVRAQNLKRDKLKLSVLPEYYPGSKALGLRAKITF